MMAFHCGACRTSLLEAIDLEGNASLPSLFVSTIDEAIYSSFRDIGLTSFTNGHWRHDMCGEFGIPYMPHAVFAYLGMKGAKSAADERKKAA